jgi:ankyrin repeat protein
MSASYCGKFEVVKWLLLTYEYFRVNINATDKNGNTALQRTIEYEEDAIATLLREHGAE